MAIPKYIQSLISQGELHGERLANLRSETDDLTHKVDDLKEIVETIRRDIAGKNQQLIELARRADEWDRRWWGFVALMIGALMSLAAGLIVTLVRK